MNMVTWVHIALRLMYTDSGWVQRTKGERAHPLDGGGWGRKVTECLFLNLFCIILLKLIAHVYYRPHGVGKQGP